MKENHFYGFLPREDEVIVDTFTSPVKRRGDMEEDNSYKHNISCMLLRS